MVWSPNGHFYENTTENYPGCDRPLYFRLVHKAAVRYERLANISQHLTNVKADPPIDHCKYRCET